MYEIHHQKKLKAAPAGVNWVRLQWRDTKYLSYQLPLNQLVIRPGLTSHGILAAYLPTKAYFSRRTGVPMESPSWAIPLSMYWDLHSLDYLCAKSPPKATVLQPELLLASARANHPQAITWFTCGFATSIPGIGHTNILALQLSKGFTFDFSSCPQAAKNQVTVKRSSIILKMLNKTCRTTCLSEVVTGQVVK